MKLSVFLISFLLSLGYLSFIVNAVEVEAAHYEWIGVMAYVAIDRKTAQNILDSYNGSPLDECKDSRLYLPDTTEFPDLLTSDQHAMYIDFGMVRSTDFEESPHISIYGPESALMLPFLSNTPGGTPDLTLALAQYYQRDRGEVPRSSTIVAPFIPIDFISVTDEGSVWRNGNDVLEVSFDFPDPCTTPLNKMADAFKNFANTQYELGISGPDLQFCDRNPVQNEYCTTLQCIKYGLQCAAPNVCQKYTQANSDLCDATMTFINLTEGFQKIIGVSDNVVQVLQAKRVYGNFTASYVYPCL
ncbi:hypothetical protein HOLleu_37257 [Holothuria leucospilota]|uniref:Uncharacterized protein n=1 Tax=Holothuria leucospilota TaxID=206669 RepID=A0A9Q0YLL8_HOLLE|nr:hypothetical protein HOLleu_37257 [Holothuria leucospilota]